MACFDGEYPIELPAGNLIGKHLLEGVGKRATMPDATAEAATASVAGLEADYAGMDQDEPLVASPGGANALHHP